MPYKNENPKMIGTETAKLNEMRTHLEGALTTLKLMPLGNKDQPLRVKSSWGGFHQAAVLSMSSHRRPLRHKPSPDEINTMEQWLDALLGLPDDERRIVVARACRIPWRRLEEMDGRSHTTLRKVERLGLLKLSAIINDQGRVPSVGLSSMRSRRQTESSSRKKLS